MDSASQELELLDSISKVFFGSSHSITIAKWAGRNCVHFDIDTQHLPDLGEKQNDRRLVPVEVDVVQPNHVIYHSAAKYGYALHSSESFEFF